MLSVSQLLQCVLHSKYSVMLLFVVTIMFTVEILLENSAQGQGMPLGTGSRNGEFALSPH